MAIHVEVCHENGLQGCFPESTDQIRPCVLSVAKAQHSLVAGFQESVVSKMRPESIGRSVCLQVVVAMVSSVSFNCLAHIP